MDEGLVRAIGVSNFSIKKLQDLLSYARIQPVVNQIECHPYLRNQANIDFCRSKVCQQPWMMSAIRLSPAKGE